MQPWINPERDRDMRSTPTLATVPTSYRYWRWLKSEDGSTAVEYAVIIGLVCSVLLTSVRALGSASMATFSQLSSALESAPEYSTPESRIEAPVSVSVPAPTKK